MLGFWIVLCGMLVGPPVFGFIVTWRSERRAKTGSTLCSGRDGKCSCDHDANS